MESINQTSLLFIGTQAWFVLKVALEFGWEDVGSSILWKPDFYIDVRLL